MWDFQFPSNADRNDWFTASNSAALSYCSSLLLYQFWLFWAGFDFVTWSPNILILAGSLWKINQWAIVLFPCCLQAFSSGLSLVSHFIESEFTELKLEKQPVIWMWLCLVRGLWTLNVAVAFRILGLFASCSLNLHNKILNFIYEIDLLHSHSVFSLNLSILRNSPFSQEYRK